MSESTTAVAPVEQIDPELLGMLEQFNIPTEEDSAEKVNSLSIKGSKFRYTIDGETTTVETMFNGEPMAAPSINAIILRQVPESKWDRCNSYYEGTYVEGSNKAPDCYSTHGQKPDASVREPQHTDCKTCPQKVKGSGATADNPDGKACKVNRRLAVVINEEKSHTPLKLQLAITSLWEDKAAEAENKKNGWYAYDTYIEYLKSQGIPKSIMVETTIKFDAKASQPKCLFKMVRVLPTEMLKKVLPLYNSEPVVKVLGLDREPVVAKAVQPAIEAPVAVAQVDVKPEVKTAPASVAPVEKPKAAAKPAPKVEEVSATVGEQLSDW